ncbi:MAG: S49 family peptidase, partial [Bacteroidia bacterium]|nr:S49 family peptidase [Bacteroidia bacterium]
MAAIVSFASNKEVKVKPNSVLHLELDQPIADRSSSDPFANFNPASISLKPDVGLNDIIKSIHYAKTDDNIKGIYFNTQMFSSGLATATEIRDALEDFKISGKFVIAFGDSYSQRSYYLASVADQVYLQPEGILEFKGLAAQAMFFKNAMDKLGVEPQVIREGKYKSAIEQFTLDKMSEENKHQIKELVDDFWKHMVDKISISRSIDADKLTEIANSLSATRAEDAFENNLVDGLKYQDEVHQILLEKTESPEDELNSIGVGEYSKSVKAPKGGYKKDRIAVVYAEGEIMYGEQPEGKIGSEGVAEAIKKAREDDKVKAIV